MGDFNSRLSRNTENCVGRWCIHKRCDAGGERLLHIMNMSSLRCVSTYYQPRKGHNNATYMNIQPEKPPSQIDYILVSKRWSSSIRNCKTKWGVPIEAYGRKYDHALVTATFKLRLKSDRGRVRKDFNILSQDNIKSRHEEIIQESLKSERPQDANGQWKRLKKALEDAQSTLPKTQPKTRRKWEASEHTLDLVQKRVQEWDHLDAENRKTFNKEIARSARNDFREHTNRLLEDIESANSVGNSTEVYRLAKDLSTKKSGRTFIQPSVDNDGKDITKTEEQLEAWAIFLEKKFSARPEDPEIQLNEEDEDEVPDPSLEEVETCIKKLKKGKAPGPDTIPIEQYKVSDTATTEVWHLIKAIWREENMPDDFVLAEMMMHYKKKSKDDRSNYRALSLLNHSYKIFAMVLLIRMLPYIEPKLSDMQAGFRKSRGCRDNILILIMVMMHFL